MKYFPLCIFSCVLVFSFLFNTPKKAYAVAVAIANAPSIITQDTFTVSASISGAQAGTNYLRIDLYKEGTTNYFGETFNSTSWYGESDGKQYLSVTVPSASPFQIQGRVGNPTLGEYDGTGTYKLRIRRYTSSGNTGSGDTLDSVSVSINFPTPTPIPTPTQAPVSNPTSAPKTTITNKPTSASAQTSIPALVITKNPTSILSKSPTATVSSDVLGTESAEITPDVSKTPRQIVKKATQAGFPLVVSIVGGILLLVGSITSTVIVLKRRKKQNGEDI